jgi:hypothetical protein
MYYLCGERRRMHTEFENADRLRRIKMKFAHIREHVFAVSLVMSLVALLLITAAHATPREAVVFSSLEGTSTPGGYVVGQYPSTTNDFAIGFPFTPSGRNYRLSEVRVLASFVHGVNDLVISLYSDSSGLPGSPLESWSEVDLDTTPEIVTVRSELHPKLEAGTQYWLVLSMAVPWTSEGIWWGNPLGEKSPQAASINGRSYTSSTLTSGAFEILGRESREE